MTADRYSPAPMNATRDRILGAAAYVLSRRGVAGTRLADIAAHAQLRTPAVYYYFRSRDDLIEEVMREGQQRVRRHVEQAIAAQPPDIPALALLDAAVEAHLRIELDMSDFASAVTRNAGQLPPAMRDSLRQESAAYHALWRGLLERLGDAGALRPGLDIGIARMLVIGALNWTAEWWNPEQDSLEHLVATAQSIVRHSLSPSGGTRSRIA
ncbi:TetR/AcrR family transcriptional regulator [Nocardia sp. NPDC059246]|uniref:TetR/AcrR family transcriptional regulator n=1 Tax=unclassified Nocardia TaxID=2637762 RepID=UPI0036D1B536